MFTKLIFNLKLLTNISFKSEKFYIINYIFKEFFGIDIEIIFLENKSRIFEIQKEGKSLIISDVFFNQKKNDWLCPSYLPKLPLNQFKLSDYGLNKCSPHSMIPIFYPSEFNDIIVAHNGNVTYLNLDIFGTIFFFLSRYEEYVLDTSDEHGRFPFKSSILSNKSLIKRPTVNEYIEILWSTMKRIWPKLRRMQHKFKIDLTIDIDRPVYKENKSLIDFDFYFKIFKFAESNSLTLKFFFISGGSTLFDAEYKLNDLEIQKLLKLVDERGHKIGLHPSYDSIVSIKKAKMELDALKFTCESLGIQQNIKYSRQHYLRFYPRSTWRNLDSIGISNDSSLSFAEHVGFRCGICNEYPVFDLKYSKKLNLLEQPLLLMDDTLFSNIYMNFSINNDEALITCNEIKNSCKFFDGTFTILFHDNNILNENYFNFLKKLTTE